MRSFVLGALFLLVFEGSVEAAMARIASRDTPAHKAALKFMRGVNLGNYLEFNAGHPAANQTYNTTDFDRIRAEGFDHVRIPVGWHLQAGPSPNYTIPSTFFTKVDTLVNAALVRGLNVIIDEHHFDEFIANPVATRPKLYALWDQIAAHYANFSDGLAFEFLNEPNGAATTAVMNTTYAELIRRVRLTNPNRTLFLGPGEWNGIGELKTGTDSGIVIPNNETNVIVTVHCYDPYYFTHQGAEWALPDTATVGVFFPGPPETPKEPDPSISHDWVIAWFRDYNTKPVTSNPSSAFAFQSRIRSLRTWADYWGRPVHLGEYGCYEKADGTSRLNFYRSIREYMDLQRLGWAMWDWKAGFHYLKNGNPDPPGMREAIFPPPNVKIDGSLNIRGDGAMGKTYVLERASSLLTPIQWQPVSTQQLTTNIFLFQVASNLNSSAVYRVVWRK